MITRTRKKRSEAAMWATGISLKHVEGQGWLAEIAGFGTGAGFGQPGRLKITLCTEYFEANPARQLALFMKEVRRFGIEWREGGPQLYISSVLLTEEICKACEKLKIKIGD